MLKGLQVLITSEAVNQTLYFKSFLSGLFLTHEISYVAKCAILGCSIPSICNR